MIQPLWTTVKPTAQETATTQHFHSQVITQEKRKQQLHHPHWKQPKGPSTGAWITVWYPANRMLLSHKQLLIQEHGWSQMLYAKWKKPDAEIYIWYNCICTPFWKRQNYRDINQGCWGRGEVINGQGKGSLGGDGNDLYLDCGGGHMTGYICQHLWCVHLKRMN